MPNQPRKDNPSRAIRVEDELWHDALDAAAENDDTVSQVVRRALRDYVKRTQLDNADFFERNRRLADVIDFPEG